MGHFQRRKVGTRGSEVWGWFGGLSLDLVGEVFHAERIYPPKRGFQVNPSATQSRGKRQRRALARNHNHKVREVWGSEAYREKTGPQWPYIRGAYLAHESEGPGGY